MKFPLGLTLVVSVILIGTACKKHDNDIADCVSSPKKIQFILYTDKDFSQQTGNISFVLSVRTSRNQVIWDTLLPPMQLNDIPTYRNRLVIEKIITSYDPPVVRAGYLYYIEDVGLSWYWDKVNPCETFKTVQFNFQ